MRVCTKLEKSRRTHARTSNTAGRKEAASKGSWRVASCWREEQPFNFLSYLHGATVQDWLMFQVLPGHLNQSEAAII